MMLQSAYFEAFKADATLLFWGSTSGMKQLSAFLKGASNGENRELSLSSVATPVDRRLVTLRIASEVGGMTEVLGGFDWILDVGTVERFSELIAALAESGSPGHHYLEAACRDAITVMISVGEYPDDLRPTK